MTDLKARLKAMIRASGPVSVAAYMDLCLHDRRHGYYATRPGLGEDFITAPETSQVFGELIGLWAAHEWQQMGAPERFSLIEIGPGRGTLMADALRATAGVPGFHAAMDICFIETSPVLKSHLTERFAASDIQFLNDLDAVPTDRPFLLIANEWLDCLPVQQFVKVGAAWHERVIGLDANGTLQFGLNSSALPDEISPSGLQTSIEIQPGLKTLISTLQHLFSTTPGRALFIDYGPADGSPEDTLRSYLNGAQIDPLAEPGQSDLTCDVDFNRLRQLTRSQTLRVDGPITQSQFLLALGAEARLNQLAKQHPDQADEIYARVKKLVDPSEMGSRFQVLTIGHPHLPSATAFPIN
ncbi:MAG: SAM-dependent methyltransferase [Pseudomonadota bacterium]